MEKLTKKQKVVLGAIVVLISMALFVVLAPQANDNLKTTLTPASQSQSQASCDSQCGPAYTVETMKSGATYNRPSSTYAKCMTDCVGRHTVTPRPQPEVHTIKPHDPPPVKTVEPKDPPPVKTVEPKNSPPVSFPWDSEGDSPHDNSQKKEGEEQLQDGQSQHSSVGGNNSQESLPSGSSSSNVDGDDGGQASQPINRATTNGSSQHLYGSSDPIYGSSNPSYYERSLGTRKWWATPGGWLAQIKSVLEGPLSLFIGPVIPEATEPEVDGTCPLIACTKDEDCAKEIVRPLCRSDRFEECTGFLKCSKYHACEISCPSDEQR